MLPTLSADKAAMFLGPKSARAASSASEPFDYAILKGKARALAQTPYSDHTDAIPKAVKKMTWDQYQAIRFNTDHSLWRNTDSKFRAHLSHLGLYFLQPISIYELKDGKAKRSSTVPNSSITASPRSIPGNFRRTSVLPASDSSSARTGFAMWSPSSARAISRRGQGDAVRPVRARPGRGHSPAPTRGIPDLHCLLAATSRSGQQHGHGLRPPDSPSITGAYRFDITPGDTLTMRVDAALYPRKPIERLGIARLTSMYMVGENDRRTGYDWRPEIHDSDGLAMQTGSGEWIWRPLNNPRILRFNTYMDENPKAFGLLQRDQNFDHYQDDGVYYDKRPGLW